MIPSDKEIADKLWAELEAAGYLVSWTTWKGPATEPNNDYDWLGQSFSFTGPKGRFRTAVSRDWLPHIIQGHAWAFGSVNEAIQVNDQLTTEGATPLDIACKEILRTRFVYDQETECHSRVRRHQVKEQHTHFWDDQKQRWIDLKTL